MPQQTLENVLRNWEDTFFITQEQSRLIGSSAHSFDWRDLRRMLLNVKPLSPEFGGIDQSITLDVWDKKLVRGPLAQVSHLLAVWGAASRRVFSVNPLLGRYLQDTDVGGLAWKDVIPPFQVFGIQLEQPVWIESAKSMVDFLLPVFNASNPELPDDHPDRHTPVFGCFLVSSGIRDISFLTDTRRKEIEDAVTRKDALRAGRLMEDHLRRLNGVRYLQVGVPMREGMSIAESVESHYREKVIEMPPGSRFTHRKLSKWERDEMRQITELCVAFCIYAQQANRAKYLSVSELPVEEEMDRNMRSRGKQVVTEGSKVCRIEARILTPEERLKRTKYNKTDRQQSPHPRKGYTRRKWGKGNDEDAERIVPVPPLYVHPERMAEGEVSIAKESVMR